MLLTDEQDVSGIDPPVHEPDDGDRDPIRWITVATFSRSPEVHIARLKLESEDIDCLIVDENIVATDFLYAQAVGGIKLQVPEEDADRARRILIVTPKPVADDAPQQALHSCPECGSENIKRPLLQRQTFWAAIVALMLVGTALLAPFAIAGFVYYLIMWRPWRCRDCGDTFTTNTDDSRGFPIAVSSAKENPRQSRG